jgi:hypothetical protein
MVSATPAAHHAALAAGCAVMGVSSGCSGRSADVRCPAVRKYSVERGRKAMHEPRRRDRKPRPEK